MGRHSLGRALLVAASGSTQLARVALCIPTGYLTVITAAAWLGTWTGRGRPARAVGRTRFAVLVPAHDEEAVIASAVGALQRLTYPASSVSVVVVADHCGDRTVEIARAAGADVREHIGPERGKGPALAWCIGELLDAANVPDVIVVVDADTHVEPRFLHELEVWFAAGSQVVQGQYRVLEPGTSPIVGLRAAALALRHHLRPLGRTTIGASSGLYGNGMAFRTAVLAHHRWSNHLTEDLELQMELLRAGVLVDYAPRAVVEAAMPSSLQGARTQNERWERGRLQLARAYVPQLVRDAVTARRAPRVAIVDGVLDHLVPPLSVLAASIVAVSTAQIGLDGLRGRWRPRRALALPGLLGVHVVSGLVLARMPWSVYRSLLGAPRLVWWKLALVARVGRRGNTVEWTRTARTEPGP